MNYITLQKHLCKNGTFVIVISYKYDVNLKKIARLELAISRVNWTMKYEDE